MKRAGILLVFAALILAGCASFRTGSGLSVAQLQQVGEKLLAAGDTAGALKYLTEAEAKQPNNAVIQYYLALAYKQRGMSPVALAHLQKALQIKPNYSEALNAIGAVYAEGGQFELARDSFQKAMADPFYHTPQLAAYNLGSLYEKKGEPERALVEYERAIQFQPGYGEAWFRKAQILETMRRGDEARNAYGRAVTGAPDLAEAHLRYGIMSYKAGDMEAALFSLIRVTKLAPNTDMATEAKIYLSRLKGVIPATQHGATSSREGLPADIEVISPRTTTADARQSATGPPAPPPATVQPLPAAPAPEQPLPAAPAPEQALAVPPPPGRPLPLSPAPEQPMAAALFTPFSYIVQLGSFVDKEKAEEMKKTLQEKGYSPVIKPLKHDVLGKVYVIQLKPEPSFSRATTMVTQLKDVVQGEPVILKVPAEARQVDTSKPAELQRPAKAQKPAGAVKPAAVKKQAELKKSAVDPETAEPKLPDGPKPLDELKPPEELKPADARDTGSTKAP